MWAYSRNIWYARPSLCFLKLARDCALLREGEEGGSRRVGSALKGNDCGTLGWRALLRGCGGFTDVWGGLMSRERRRKASWLGDRFSLCDGLRSLLESLLQTVAGMSEGDTCLHCRAVQAQAQISTTICRPLLNTKTNLTTAHQSLLGEAWLERT